MKNNAKKYFDSVAENYEKDMSKFFFKHLKQTEKKYVLKLLNVKKNEEILDAGCGTGFYSRPIVFLGGKVLGIDVSQKMVKMARKAGIKAKVVDLHEFSLNQKFDKILCVGVLEFCKSPEVVIKILTKHLKQNGILVILFPKISISTLFYKLYHQFHKIKIRLFAEDEIRQILLSNNLKIVKIVDATPLSCIIKAKKL